MGSPSPQEAMGFYSETINHHRFDALLPVLSKEVVFWFNSGSHRGVAAARQAFEATWAGIVDEHYWLEDLVWLSGDAASACCIFRFRWRGTVEGKPIEGGGRGTTILRRETAGWMIIHEHLSAEPK
jgi:hypothetical protein